MSTFEKLRVRIKRDIGVELTDFKRTMAGRVMMGSGAFSWTSKIVDSGSEVGSGFSATYLLNKKEPLSMISCPSNTGIREIV